MSVFCDIWIGDKQPSFKRSFCDNWSKEGEVYWLSKTSKGNDILREVNYGSFKLILLGQLYEEVDDSYLIKQCISYIENPESKYTDPAGHYILFLLNKDDKTTHVFTNRLSSYHAYWSDEKGHKSISSYYIGLAKESSIKSLDWDAISGYMAMGYFPNNKTYLRSIKQFSPCSYYRFDSSLSLVEERRYWDWEYYPVQKAKDKALDEVKSIIHESLNYSTKAKVTALPISGGLDSRLLAGELKDINTDVKSFSYGYVESSIENKIANKIAAENGWRHYSYVMSNYLFDRVDDIAHSVELFQYVDGTRQVSASDWLSVNSNIVVGGHWGDVWFDRVEVENLHYDFGKKIIKKGSAWLLENVCDSKGADKDFLNDYFSSFVNRYVHVNDKSFLFKIYKTEEWSARWTTASLRSYQLGSFPVLPFYDRRVVDFFTSIPDEYNEGRQLQISYIKKYHKELAKVKWQEYDASLYTYKRFNNRNVFYRGVNKIGRVLSSEKTIQRNWEVFYFTEDGRASLEKLLLNNNILLEYVSRNRVKELLAAFYKSPNREKGYAVSMLLTFSLFLKEIYE